MSEQSALKSERSSWRDRSLYNSEWYNEIAKKCSGFCQNPTVKPCLSARSSRENTLSTEKSLAILWDLLLLEDVVLFLLPLYEQMTGYGTHWNFKDGCKCCPSAFGKMDEQDFRPDSQLNSKLRCGDHCTQNLSLLYDQLYLQPFRLVKKFKCSLKESLDTLWMMDFGSLITAAESFFISISSICRDYWAKQK